MIGFIGGGNMAEAIIKGLLKSKKFQPENIIVSDIASERLEHLRTMHNITVTNKNSNVFEKANVIILAVKPQVIFKVLKEVKTLASVKHLLISIAAGVSIKNIEDILGNGLKIIRVMPNVAAFALESMCVLSFNKNIEISDKQKAEIIFSSIGKVIQLDEIYLDAVTAISGSGPGFVAVIMEAFTDAAVNIGLPRNIAEKLVLQTFKGTVKLMEQSGKSPNEIKNMVTSPGGTTIRGIYAFEKEGLRKSIFEGCLAAFNRSKELSN